MLSVRLLLSYVINQCVSRDGKDPRKEGDILLIFAPCQMQLREYRLEDLLCLISISQFGNEKPQDTVLMALVEALESLHVTVGIGRHELFVRH